MSFYSREILYFIAESLSIWIPGVCQFKHNIISFAGSYLNSPKLLIQ